MMNIPSVCKSEVDSSIIDYDDDDDIDDNYEMMMVNKESRSTMNKWQSDKARSLDTDER